MIMRVRLSTHPSAYLNWSLWWCCHHHLGSLVDTAHHWRIRLAVPSSQLLRMDLSVQSLLSIIPDVICMDMCQFLRDIGYHCEHYNCASMQSFCR